MKCLSGDLLPSIMPTLLTAAPIFRICSLQKCSKKVENTLAGFTLNCICNKINIHLSDNQAGGNEESEGEIIKLKP